MAHYLQRRGVAREDSLSLLVAHDAQRPMAHSVPGLSSESITEIFELYSRPITNKYGKAFNIDSAHSGCIPVISPRETDINDFSDFLHSLPQCIRLIDKTRQGPGDDSGRRVAFPGLKAASVDVGHVSVATGDRPWILP